MAKMNLKCHLSALGIALLSIENKLIIFDLTIFNYGLSNSSIFNQAQDSTFSTPKTQFSPRFFSFPTPSHSYIKPLYVRELDNIFINNLN